LPVVAAELDYFAYFVHNCKSPFALVEQAFSASNFIKLFDLRHYFGILSDFPHKKIGHSGLFRPVSACSFPIIQDWFAVVKVFWKIF